MEIYVLAHSLKRTSRREGLSLFDLPRFVRGLGFEGLEISDRQIAGLGEDALRRFAGECQNKRCGLIVDINVNFTSADRRFLDEEIEHSKRMIRMASGLGAWAMRICLGGQTVSVQKLSAIEGA